ncbi:uncharacterized protein K02A2.6-like [Pseudomyrmex gracilis]|uniref:uncharacterized protein K02A2.6-like n=1 Tax=Pseudomyrmex gracilis TaxID=219809 RepID=UPI0009948FE7|nr:uncharacterized protein K02A2.6-like [Pseudomyrmex gracilis]
MEGLREILAPLMQQQQQQQQQFQQQLQQQFYAQQQDFVSHIAKIIKAPLPSSATGMETTMETLANSISEFVYDPENGLIFDACLRSAADADICNKLLHLIDTKPDSLTIEDLVIECQRLVNLKQDTLLIFEATKKDDILQEAIKYAFTSWPQIVDQKTLQPYFRKRHSLSVVQGCLVFNDRVVVPFCFRSQILKQLHKGHPGITRMKVLARSYFYWPKIDADIEWFVKQCRNCAFAAKAPVKVPLQSWTQPTAPWQRIHIDYAGPLNGEYFFVLVDAFSKWPEIIPTQSISAQQTINILQSIFARFGIPETIVSDNGTQFISEKFQTFCLTNGIQHLRSLPFHPSSNGQAERFVTLSNEDSLNFKQEETIALLQ